MKENLEEAFFLTLSLPDCAGASNLDSCRAMERLLSESFETLEDVVATHRKEGSSDCLSCDVRPHLAPLAASLEALGRLLVEKGHVDFAPAFRVMEQPLELMLSYRCCVDAEAAPGPSDREDNVRAVLTAKCGASFVDNRRGLRQVLRAPGDREGCFQSRACRKTDSYEGLAMQAGFWTYDGEYWYIWAERRSPTGDWITCEP
ncbi:MAG: hypothetical protein ACRD21_07985 [Vicinamibacteria bacterium]